MPRFLVWYAGDDEQGFADTAEEAEEEFGSPDTVKASGEAAAVMAWARENEVELYGNERYFVERLKPGSVFRVDVDGHEGQPPTLRAYPLLRAIR